MSQIAFIGLGNMGAPMARHLMDAGHTLAVYARRPAVVQPFSESGARVAASPADAARDAGFVFTNVTATSDVEAVILGRGAYAGAGVIDGARPGTVVCDMSTIDAGATRNIAARLAQRGIDLLDCPVSGGTAAARAATLSIMVGGDAAVLERARPLLEKLGKSIFHMGGNGAGQVTKACNQIVQVINIQGVAEGMLFARNNGVDCAKVVEALMAGFASSKMLGLMGPKMAARDFAAGIEARLHHKDFSLVLEMAEAQHLPMPAMTLVQRQLSALMERGWGYDDTSSLLKVLEAELEPQNNRESRKP